MDNGHSMCYIHHCLCPLCACHFCIWSAQFPSCLHWWSRLYSSSTMLLLTDLCASFSLHPSLIKTVMLDNINHFLQLVHHFLNEIKLHVPPNCTAPPYRLPIYVHQLIRSCLDLDDNIVTCLWDTLKDVIWEDPEQDTHEGLSKDQIDKIDLHTGKSVHPEEWLGVQFWSLLYQYC